MSIILFKRGTGSPVKVNEHGFEHSVASGEYFLTKDAAISADKVAAVELPRVEEGTPPEEKTEETATEEAEAEERHEKTEGAKAPRKTRRKKGDLK
jgi:hypothetical protein